jgi:hypothetical protein
VTRRLAIAPGARSRPDRRRRRGRSPAIFRASAAHMDGHALPARCLRLEQIDSTRHVRASRERLVPLEVVEPQPVGQRGPFAAGRRRSLATPSGQGTPGRAGLRSGHIDGARARSTSALASAPVSSAPSRSPKARQIASPPGVSVRPRHVLLRVARINRSRSSALQNRRSEVRILSGALRGHGSISQISRGSAEPGVSSRARPGGRRPGRSIPRLDQSRAAARARRGWTGRSSGPA